MKKSTIILTVFLTITILTICAMVLFASNWSMDIDMKNTKSVVEYGEELVPPTAKLSSKRIDIKPVKIRVHQDRKIDTSKVGVHDVNYFAYKWFYYTKVEHSVSVVDKKPPVIELVHNEGSYTLPGDEYEEEGYSAFDEYDGDITDKVVKEQHGNIVTYYVEDSSGNSAIVERNIKYNDPIAPEITLNGESEVTILQWEKFDDPGATATDNCDGDITSKIVVDSDVNISKPGKYTVTYTVEDAYKNSASETRIVKVVEKKVEESSSDKKTSKKTIYLTFDDGPSKHTKKLLNVLKKYDVKATFFVVGNAGNEDILKRIVKEGHSIGLHSTNHKYSEIYASEKAFVDDLLVMQKYIKDVTGVETYLLRFPGGSSNTVSKNYKVGVMTALTKKVNEMGFQYFDWNVDSCDASSAKTAKDVVKNVKNGVKDYRNSVVLQHDIKEFSVDAVEDIIKWGLENGYKFEKLTVDSPAAHHGVNN